MIQKLFLDILQKCRFDRALVEILAAGISMTGVPVYIDENIVILASGAPRHFGSTTYIALDTIISVSAPWIVDIKHPNSTSMVAYEEYTKHPWQYRECGLLEEIDAQSDKYPKNLLQMLKNYLTEFLSKNHYLINPASQKLYVTQTDHDNIVSGMKEIIEEYKPEQEKNEEVEERIIEENKERMGFRRNGTLKPSYANWNIVC